MRYLNFRHLLAGLIMAVIASTSPVLAGSHPDFTGTWVLDLDASESVEPLLAAQGRSWVERKAANSVVITQVVTQTEETITLDVTSVATNRHDELKPGTGWQPSKTDRAESAKTRVLWSEDGQSLITETLMTFEGGEQATMKTTRSMTTDGQTTYMLLEFIKGGVHERSKRVLRKQ